MLDSKDYFKWFNEEITRYRNHEWQLATFASAAFGFFAAWVSDPNRQNAILSLHMWIPATVIMVIVAFCLFAENYSHRRLNEYRAAQKWLRRYPHKPEDALSAKRERMTIVDGLYFFTFNAFILLWGVFALYALRTASGRAPQLGRAPCVQATSAR